MDWLTIREEFPDLNASQVQQLLGEYQLNGKTRPRGWYPPPEEVEAALRTCKFFFNRFFASLKVNSFLRNIFTPAVS